MSGTWVGWLVLAQAWLQGPPPRSALELLARFRGEPSVRAVQRAAARAAGANPERLRSWMSRARRAPWLPQLRVRVLRGIEDDLLTNTNGQTRATDDDLTIDVQVRWDLSRLVFDRNELYVSREVALRSELRDEAVARATRLYFLRRRLQVDLILARPSSLAERLRRLLRIREIAARLDGLTGGFFGRALRKKR